MAITDTFVASDGHRFDLKHRMTWGDRQAYSLVLMRISAYMKDPEQKVRAVPARVALVELNLVGWDLKDEQGTALPVTRENIEALAPDIGDEVAAEIDRRNRPKAMTTA